MQKLENFIEKVNTIGSVFDHGDRPMDMTDWDDIFKRFSAMDIEGEVVYYCSPKLLQELLDLLKNNDAYLDNGSYGEFHKKDNAWGYMVEATFFRGSYTTHAVCKNIEGGVLVPQFPEEEWGTDKLARSSINIK